MKEEDLNLTLEDVETAIHILEVFLNRMRKAEIMLRRVAMYSRRSFGVYNQRTISPSNMSFEDFVNLALEMEKRKKGVVEETEPEPLTEEELNKMRRLANKYSKRLESEDVSNTTQ
ncbi:hypothetical protein KEJ27_09800 [Candidatus Bathyarchaeota archaeon]|nr:hypothetical protein [Candidatus Bathyarchaeota archaeon]